MVITSASRPADPNEETLHWLRCIELGKTAYRPPFQVTQEIEIDRQGRAVVISLLRRRDGASCFSSQIFEGGKASPSAYAVVSMSGRHSSVDDAQSCGDLFMCCVLCSSTPPPCWGEIRKLPLSLANQKPRGSHGTAYFPASTAKRTINPCFFFQRDEYIDEDLVSRSSQARPARCECGAPYAEALGYCRCVAAPVALDPAFEFRDALLAHLAERERGLPDPHGHLRFQFARDVRDEPRLREAAARVVDSYAAAAVARRPSGGVVGSGSSSGRRPSAAGPAAARAGAATAGGGVQQARVIELLRAVMSSLHRDGALHFSDKAEDVYVLVSRGRVLQPAVEEACRRRGLGLSQENEIIRALQGSALFHHVPGARIRACVHRMKKSGSTQQWQQPGTP